MDKYKSIAFLLFCPLLAVCAYIEDTENLNDAKKKVDFAEESINLVVQCTVFGVQ